MTFFGSESTLAKKRAQGFANGGTAYLKQFAELPFGRQFVSDTELTLDN
jgi:hypothetical protein